MFETNTAKINNSVDLMMSILGVQNQSRMDAELLAGSFSRDLEHLVQTMRQHLGMDVAFLSRFHNGHREMLCVDKKRHL